MTESTHKLALAVRGTGASATQIKKWILSSELQCCFINPSLVVDQFQIEHAVNLASISVTNSEQKTRSIHTEILYCLSPTKKISDSLKLFGLGDDSQSAIIITVDDPSGEKLDQVLTKIEWEASDISEIATFSDLDLVKKHYKIKPNELLVGTISEAVINRMSAKEFVAF